MVQENYIIYRKKAEITLLFSSLPNSIIEGDV